MREYELCEELRPPRVDRDEAAAVAYFLPEKMKQNYTIPHNDYFLLCIFPASSRTVPPGRPAPACCRGRCRPGRSAGSSGRTRSLRFALIFLKKKHKPIPFIFIFAISNSLWILPGKYVDELRGVPHPLEAVDVAGILPISEKILFM